MYPINFRIFDNHFYTLKVVFENNIFTIYLFVCTLFEYLFNIRKIRNKKNKQ